MKCIELHGCNMAGKIASLITTATECGFKSITLETPDDFSGSIYNLSRQVILHNPIITVKENSGYEPDRDGSGDYIICSSRDFICLRDYSDPRKYSLKVLSHEDAADFSARVAGLISNLMGFPGFIAFGVRFTVYELMNNIVEYGLSGLENEWISLGMEKKGHKLIVSIADEGIEFDPTDSRDFNLESYIRGGETRGLGLIMIKRMNEKMEYARKGGLNRTVINNVTLEHDSVEKEREMSPLVVSNPELIEKGMYRITLDGELDSKGALDLEHLMNKLLDKGIYKVILDFKDVSFISSAGVGMLLGLVSSLRREDGEVYMTELSYNVKSVFDLLNLNDYFKFLDQSEMAR